jgi:histidine phosphotransferase ChpT
MGDVTFRRKLAEVLTARLCHELVNPLGAVSNGVEVLEEDPAFAAEAAKLIATSARQAAIRLQFYRLAYGATVELSAVGVARVVADFFADSKTTCLWPDAWPDEYAVWLKPVMNLAVLACDCLPRGGEIRLDLPAAKTPAFLIWATGIGARLPDVLGAVTQGDPSPEDLTPRTAHAAFTAILAQDCGGHLDIRQNAADTVCFKLHIGE